MTMPSDPFQPSAPESDATPPASIAQEWTDALNDPKVRSSLLSAGLTLMSPQPYGQTTMGHFAQAIGSAGETLSRQDEETRKDREQARKERDTNSQVDYRADTSDTKRTLADVATERAASATERVRQQGLLTESQVQLNIARAGQAQAQVETLQAKVAMFPQDQQAKIELARARQGLLEAQTRVATERANAVAPQAEARVRRDNSTADLNQTRQENVGANTDIRRGQLDATNRKLGLQETLDRQKGERQDRRTYETAKKDFERNQSMEPAARRKTFPSFQEWRSSNSAPAAPSEAPAQTPAPAAPVAPSASVDVGRETANAQRALSATSDDAMKAKIRQLYKERTGKDLP